MDYFISRAMEVGRLTEGQLEVLHFKEERENQCLVPHEIQRLFKSQKLKEWYSLPNDDTEQAKNNQSLRLQMEEQGLTPGKGDLNVTDVLGAHEWDGKILQAVKDGKIDFYYHGNVKKRLRDSVEAVVLIGFVGLALLR